MISGAHVVVYSKNAQADRAFFRDVLGFQSVDAGDGWLIFALPPAEAAFHPSEENGVHELYLMCQDERPKSLPSRTTTSGGGREGIPSGRQKSASIDRSIPLP